MHSRTVAFGCFNITSALLKCWINWVPVSMMHEIRSMAFPPLNSTAWLHGYYALVRIFTPYVIALFSIWGDCGKACGIYAHNISLFLLFGTWDWCQCSVRCQAQMRKAERTDGSCWAGRELHFPLLLGGCSVSGLQPGNLKQKQALQCKF